MSQGAGRGGGWVVAQFLLIGVIVVTAILGPGWSGAAGPLLVVGLALVVVGGLVVVWSARALGRSLTPFPRPAAGAALVETGPFAVVRHPVYAGGIVVFVGISLVAGPLVLAPTAALAVLWALKARVEEGHLDASFPGYRDYAARVRHRLVPGVY